MSTTSRKEEHVKIVTERNVDFQHRTAGFEHYEFEYNALPELDFSELSCSIEFLDKGLNAPLIVTGMTGGYPNAETINAGLAAACQEVGVAFGTGSARAALFDSSLRSTHTIARQKAPSIPILANIGAAQIAQWHKSGKLLEYCEEIMDFTGADALAVHINALQELMQPEGEPQFKGVTQAIASLVSGLKIPVLVKEVGAGISSDVATRLAAIGVHYLDVAGAGGTSWAGVEILRNEKPDALVEFWDVGIPTTSSILQCKEKIPTIIASGGIRSGTDVAKSIALGAKLGGAAKPFLQAFLQGGTAQVVSELNRWQTDIKRWMFLTGSSTLEQLAKHLYTTR